MDDKAIQDETLYKFSKPTVPNLTNEPPNESNHVSEPSVILPPAEPYIVIGKVPSDESSKPTSKALQSLNDQNNKEPQSASSPDNRTSRTTPANEPSQSGKPTYKEPQSASSPDNRASRTTPANEPSQKSISTRIIYPEIYNVVMDEEIVVSNHTYDTYSPYDLLLPTRKELEWLTAENVPEIGMPPDYSNETNEQRKQRIEQQKKLDLLTTLDDLKRERIIKEYELQFDNPYAVETLDLIEDNPVSSTLYLIALNNYLDEKSTYNLVRIGKAVWGLMGVTGKTITARKLTYKDPSGNFVRIKVNKNGVYEVEIIFPNPTTQRMKDNHIKLTLKHIGSQWKLKPPARYK